jgi:coenzyme F420-reducing hydrogenase delta subunit
MSDDEIKTAATWFKGGDCGGCTLCLNMCPFDALDIQEGEKEPTIITEKCQVCGICSAGCPISAIGIAYYDDTNLLKYVKKQMKALKTNTLVLMCRGSSPPSCEILDILERKDVKIFIPLRLPCVGRLSLNLYLGLADLGIERILALQCEEDYCRFEKGSNVSALKLDGLPLLLEDMGYENIIETEVISRTLKAVYDTQSCVGCDKCEYICPYDAIKAQGLATPGIDMEICRGCGICGMVCPHLAIQLHGFEYLMSAPKAKQKAPNILVLVCRWSEFSALDTMSPAKVKKNVHIREIPCFNALDPVLVLEAFYDGFDGVLAITCSDDDCKFKEGRPAGKRSSLALKKTLKKLGIIDRFEMNTTSPRYPEDFTLELKTFIQRISKLPKRGDKRA